MSRGGEEKERECGEQRTDPRALINLMRWAVVSWRRPVITYLTDGLRCHRCGGSKRAPEAPLPSSHLDGPARPCAVMGAHAVMAQTTQQDVRPHTPGCASRGVATSTVEGGLAKGERETPTAPDGVDDHGHLELKASCLRRRSDAAPHARRSHAHKG